MDAVIGKSHNSFLSESAKGQEVLVIVPHEDDEINVAGSVIYDYVKKGANVTCVFTTNGDYSFAAATRMSEAERSLQTLGVQRIFFLGYSDTSNHYSGGHLFYAKQDPVTSPSGHQETYGALNYEDYAFQVRGRHSPYCRASMCKDLEFLLLQLLAPIVFCVDLDVHVDHRATSLIFEEALGNILKRPGNTYQPVVFKGFAYCTSFGAPRDFYAYNIRSVPLPVRKEDSLIGISLYEWQKRVRFPVLPPCRGHFLRHNLLYQALFAHASQSAALHAVRIANGDAVFWQRRTDNLVYQADVVASSGNPQRIADFSVVNLVDINTKKLSFSQYLWTPSADDSKRTLRFSWSEEKDIAWVELGGNIDSSCHRIKKVTLSFPDDSIYELGPLPEKGRILRFKIPEIKRTSVAYLHLDDVTGNRYGLSFVGFYSQEYQEGIIPVYIKLMVGDDFAYDYFLPTSVMECQLSIYRYGTTERVRYCVNSASEGWVDENGLAHFSPSSDVLHIRAELEEHSWCYDEICLYRRNAFALKKLYCQQYMEDKLLTFFLKKYRQYTHVRHKYLRKI